jgi:hypothetical protein
MILYPHLPKRVKHCLAIVFYNYKLKVAERVSEVRTASTFNPEREGRGGIKGGFSTCFSFLDLHQAIAGCRSF